MAQQWECQFKSLPAIKVAALRMHVPYKDCGQGFSKLYKKFWFSACGPAMTLCYDTEYKDVANYEVAVPVNRGQSQDGIEVRDLPATRCISLLHKGPYDGLGQSYAKARAFAEQNGCKLAIPSREIYLKGCGMIFKGNPKNYLTEIQLILDQ